MKFEYAVFHSIPDAEVFEGIIGLHKTIFGTSDDLLNKMKNKPELLVMTAMDSKKVIGYKIGYSIDRNKFYSWLGGVDSNYRNRGVGSELMEKQHKYLIEKGYTIVQTKTMNKWRSMLILNIKCGFDVIDTYTDENGRHKIILEKKLM